MTTSFNYLTTPSRLPGRQVFVASASGALPSNASGLLFWVRGVSDLLLYPVTAFVAWELAANVYNHASAADKSLFRDSVRDDNASARLDIQTLLAMRSDEPGLLANAMVPASIVVDDNQLSSLQALTLDELSNIARIEIRVDPSRLDDDLDLLESMASDLPAIEFQPGASADIVLTAAQLARMAQAGKIAAPTESTAGFSVKLTASDSIGQEALSLLQTLAGTVAIKAESLVAIDVDDSLDAALLGLRFMLTQSDTHHYQLRLPDTGLAYLTTASLAVLKTYGDRLDIKISDGSEGLTLRLQSEKQLDRLVSNPFEVVKMSQLGIDKLSLAPGASGAMHLSLPEWKLLDAAGIAIDSAVDLIIQLHNPEDIRALVEQKTGTDVNHATVVVDSLQELGILRCQDLIRQGYQLSTQGADSLHSVRIGDADVSAFLQNSAEWLHLLEAAGVDSLSFASPVVLDTQATVALLESDMALSTEQTVAGTVTLESLPDDFFDTVGALLRDASFMSIRVIPETAGALNSYALGQTLAEFNEWALDPAIHLRFDGFQLGVPDYLLDRQSPEWRAAVEGHLAVQIVGTSDSELRILHGDG